MPFYEDSAQREREYIASQLHIPDSEFVQYPYHADIRTVRGRVALLIHWLDDTPDGVIRDGTARGTFITDIDPPEPIRQSLTQISR
jgi:hypothetical protein